MKASALLLVALSLSLLWAPLAAHAQRPEKLPLIGVLRPGSATRSPH